MCAPSLLTSTGRTFILYAHSGRSRVALLTCTTPVTRTHKSTDRDHVGIANGTAVPEVHLPRYFGKAAYVDTNPASSKKQGGGKGNWGQVGFSELEDYQYNMAKPRRRTNSFSAAAGHSALKTKFEAIDPEEAVFYDEDLHGPTAQDLEAHQSRLERSSVTSAETMGSVEEEAEGVDETVLKK